jgi:SNF2 family DNA or RNA helicase
MLKITETLLNEVSNINQRHDEADSLLAQGAVLFVKVDFIVDVYEVEAFVVNNREITVKLVISNDGKLLNFNLTASKPYWGNREPYYLAALKLLQQLKPQSFPFQYTTSRYDIYLKEKCRKQKKENARIEALSIDRSKRFVDQYRNNIQTEISQQISPTKYKIIAFLEKANSSINLRFKIGHMKKYLIKDIGQFLRDVANENSVTYGKNLTFKHSENNFDNASIKIIDLIRQMISTYEIEQSTKEIELERSLFDYFFEFYHQSLPEYSEFHTKDEQNQFTLLFKEEGKNYILSLKSKRTWYFGKKYIYTYENKTLSRIKCDPSGKSIELLKQITAQKEMLIGKKDMTDFYKFVLSDIKNYFELVGLDHMYIQTSEKKITLYGDIDDHDHITLELEYLYEGGKKEKGFNPKNQNLSLNAKKIEAYIESQAEIDKKNNVARMRANGDKGIQLVELGLPYLNRLCDVQVTDVLKRIGKKSTFSLSVGVSIKNDLLSIDLDSVDLPKSELAGILDAYKRKRKFYKLTNGEHIDLEADVFAEVSAMLETYHVAPSEIKDGHIKLDLFRAFSINDYAGKDSEYLTFNRDELFKETIKKFSNIKHSDYPVPHPYEHILRDYQKQGFKWLQTIKRYGFGGILADDMGLGKTLQIIALLSEGCERLKPNLVICPASLILNWEDEIHKFAPHLTSIVVYGSLQKRKLLLNDYKNCDVVITSYDYIRRDIDKYDDLSFNYIVLDEAQYIKNPNSKGALAVKRLKGNYRLALTGTPIENSLAEMWSIFDFLMPGYLYNYGYFQRHFETPIVKHKDEEKQQQLKNLISPFILRRTKKEVLKELPDKIEQIIKVEFSEEEYRLYLANLAQVNEALQTKLKLGKKRSAHIEILAMLTRLRQICCEPRTLYENITNPSSKLASCIDLIKTLRDNKKKMLLFSSFTSVLDLVSEALDEEKISYYTLTGRMSKDKRRVFVNKFQEDDTSVFLISLKAGGTGLNLTAAEAVIHFDPWWNISAQNQATDRAYRMGQENLVQVFKLIMKNSIEEKILNLQAAKKNLSDIFVEGNEGKVTDMSIEELIGLFRS